MNNQNHFSAEFAQWHANKIKSGIAESACRAHFEALGYAVESTGIEHIAPQYCKLNYFSTGNYIKNVREIQKLPDFLISRNHPATKVNEQRRSVGQADAVLVEAKYRTEVVLEEFTQEMLNTYQKLIDKHIHFIVYLICKRYKIKKTDTEFKSNHFVFLNFFNTDLSKNGGATGWQVAGKWDRFATLPLYQGSKDGQDFNRAYQEIVKPVLEEILG